MAMVGLESYDVLLVDANLADAMLTADGLGRGRVGRFSVTRAGTLAAAVRHLDAGRYDAVLMDLMLPDAQGLEAVKAVLAIAPEVPLVVLSGLDDERLALEAVLNGAQDYVIKGQGDAALVRRAIRYAIERKRIEHELTRLARLDALTGLPNRLLFLDRLAQAVRRIEHVGHVVGVMFIDLDGFKAVNDRYGHATGDRLLRAVAERLRRVVRRTDTVARLGGDEFTIVLEGLRHPDDAGRVADQVLLSLRQPFDVDGTAIAIGASLGIAIASQGSEVPELLTDRADAAMYRAKTRGGTSCQFDIAA